MSKRKRHKKHEDHVDESWLVPYADILTLLLALFIVLFATSNVDKEKMEKMSEVFNEIFDSGNGMVVKESPVDFEKGEAGNDNVKEPLSENAQKYVADQIQLKEIQDKMDEIVNTYNLKGQFETKLTDEGLLITIRDSVLFDVGSAKVNDEHQDVIRELAKVLKFKPERSIIITGHTDDLPLNSELYKSNWELSVDRASNFMKMLTIYNPEINVRKMSSKGLGEIDPIATNSNKEGRAMNRRVEILVQPNVSFEKEFEDIEIE